MNRFGDFNEYYIALIADMVGSRRVVDRVQVQGRLSAQLEDLNGALDRELASPAAMTAGDEVQALFAPGAGFLQAIVSITEALHPVGFVFGVGFGGLTTPVGPPTPLLDGPCFHHARDAVEAAAKGDEWVRARGFGEADPVIDGMFRLMQEIRSGWTETQVRYVHAARTLPQKDVAARFGKAPSTVSQSLSAAGYEAVRAGEAALTHFLERFVPGLRRAEPADRG